MATIGDLHEIRGELVIEWKIKDFFSLSDEKDIHYVSPKFYFSGASWILSLYPNGETATQPESWIGVYLRRMSSGSPISMACSLSLNTLKMDFTFVYDRRNLGNGFSKFISRSELMKQKTELVPSDELTIICTLKNSEPNTVSGSLFRRLQDVSDNLQEVYLEQKKTDFKLNLNGETLGAHRMILETRSPVFAAMLSHDTKENRTGEASIEDVDKSTMNAILAHMYCGDFWGLTTENAVSIYAAAEKYDVKDVKEICAEFIIRNLSVEWVCDVIQLAELYQNEKIAVRAKDYFKENASKILKSKSWKDFAKQNHDLSVELLGTLVESLLPK